MVVRMLSMVNEYGADRGRSCGAGWALRPCQLAAVSVLHQMQRWRAWSRSTSGTRSLSTPYLSRQFGSTSIRFTGGRHLFRWCAIPRRRRGLAGAVIAVVDGGGGPWTDGRVTSSCAVGSHRRLNVLNCRIEDVWQASKIGHCPRAASLTGADRPARSA